MARWELGHAVRFRDPGKQRELRSRMLQRWAHRACRLLGIRVEVHGRPPPPPFLLVSNHLGYLDIAVLASTTGLRFVAKQEVARWPIVGQRWLRQAIEQQFTPVDYGRTHEPDRRAGPGEPAVSPAGPSPH